MIVFGIAVTCVMLASRWIGVRTAANASWLVGIGEGGVVVAGGVEGMNSSKGSEYFVRVDPPKLDWITKRLDVWPKGATRIYVWVFALDSFTLPSRPTTWLARFMLWPLALAAFAAGTPTLIIARRIRRRACLGQCGSCGYALAGLTPGALCPECGKGAGPTQKPRI